MFFAVLTADRLDPKLSPGRRHSKYIVMAVTEHSTVNA